MRLAVIGTGHVGLVTCATFAAMGHEVIGVDSDDEKIRALRDVVVPFYEPGLQTLVREGVDAGLLSFTSDIGEAVSGAEVAFICVGTPPRATGEASLLAVERAAHEAASAATGPLVIVEKSTVPAGTARRVRQTIHRARPDLKGQIGVASNPEFLREGSAIQDCLQPDRILIGAEEERVFEVLRRLYEPLTSKGYPLIETSIQTAELAKHASNAFLALKISYANALARLCEKADADVSDVTKVMGLDPRIGPSFLQAGLGFGGFCFPKDLQAFERLAASVGYEFPLLREVTRLNQEAADAVYQKVVDTMWNLEDKRIAVLGLAFKPNTDDTRFSPALGLARRLLDAGANVVGYDPQAGANAKMEVPDLEIAIDAYEACAGAHCAVIATEWQEIADLDLGRVAEAMVHPVIVDGRNVFDPTVMQEMGFTYCPVGRASIT